MHRSSYNENNMDCSNSKEDGSRLIDLYNYNKQREQDLEIRQKELAEKESECSQREHSILAMIQDLQVREQECREKELRLEAWEEKLQIQEDEQNKLETMRAITVVSNSSQTNEAGRKTDNASVQENTSNPQYTMEREAETESSNAKIPAQSNMSISKTSQAHLEETSMNVHQPQADQDSIAPTPMNTAQSSQSSELYGARPAQRNSLDSAVQMHIPLPVSAASSEPHLYNCCQETKKQMHRTFINCMRNIMAELNNAEVSDLKYDWLFFTIYNPSIMCNLQ